MIRSVGYLKLVFLVTILLLVGRANSDPSLCANESLLFESHLFKNGSLIYSDEFNGALDRDHWLPRTKTWKVKEGMLIGSPDYKDAVEAQKALGRDHHLGLSPVIRLDDLPSKFVLHLRLKFEGKNFETGRPKFDIGHHINTLCFNAEGYTLKLHDGQVFVGKAPGVKLNQWIDVVLEFQPGGCWISVNGEGQLVKNAQVSMQGRSELTFKTFANAPNRIMFDSIKLWQAE